MSNNDPAPDSPIDTPNAGHEPQMPPNQASAQPLSDSLQQLKQQNEAQKQHFEGSSQRAEESLRAHRFGQFPGQGTKHQPDGIGNQGDGTNFADMSDNNPETTTTQENKLGNVGGETVNVYQVGTMVINSGDMQDFTRRFEGLTGNGSGLPDKSLNSTTKTRKYSDLLGPQLQSSDFVNDVGTNKSPKTTDLPKTEDKLSDWYSELNEYERCFVQAVAILHGIPVHEVTQAANELYQPIREYEEKERREYLSQLGTQQSYIPYTANISKPNVSSIKLRERTHTVIHRVRGADRLFWQDVDEHGLSQFGLEVLRFIARESAFTKWLSGEDFLGTLRQWPEKYSGERSWKAARALGISWWQDMHEMRRIANEWAESRKPQDWRRAASFLDGAFEVERLEAGEEAEDIKKSEILWLLDQWVERALISFNVQVGCAAAQAYSLIGRKWPGIALDGLSHLLQLPLNRESISLDIFIATVSSYVTLTWSGHVRAVLENLAACAERLSHQRSIPKGTYERQQDRFQRMVRLGAAFDAFFLIAASSLTGVREDRPASYSTTEVLPAYPTLPDHDGRDILLVGLLADEKWREQIATLLCAAIIPRDACMASLPRKGDGFPTSCEGEAAQSGRTFHLPKARKRC